jgi:hypothetical protein
MPACDDVQVDGASAGPSPLAKRRVGVGSHRLMLTWTSPTKATKVISAIVTADSDKKV